LVSKKFEEAFEGKTTNTDKLYAVANFYKTYYEFTFGFGGCPILNVGIDANHQNETLSLKVKKAIKNLQHNLASIIDEGISNGEFKAEISPDRYAKKLFAMFEGYVFLATMLKDRSYMEELSKSMIHLIDNELKK
jgi:hypothetical protein